MQVMNKIFCRESFDSPQAFIRLLKALYWNGLRKTGLLKPADETIHDQGKDRCLPFDEHPPCELCGSGEAAEVLIARDGSRIVECGQCKLWYTSPRISEKQWSAYLRSSEERNAEFTENRIQHGVALSANIKYVFPCWRRVMREKNMKTIATIERRLGRRLERVHDVGCGVGFFLRDARRAGAIVSGNELNSYACRVMRDRFGLTVFNETLSRTALEPGTLDAIVMSDYIEHSYHPLDDLRAAYNLLKPDGIAYITTFHVDSRAFATLGAEWNFLFWNHAFHFSEQSLRNMVNKSGLTAVEVVSRYDDIGITVIAQKKMRPAAS